ncbi:MAG: radical SAM protein [Deltaproteobacteria bacterium]|jgi:uncharacterized protein|nr:radical SAM protein [Deltaproteobacteria bacterium]
MPYNYRPLNADPNAAGPRDQANDQAEDQTGALSSAQPSTQTSTESGAQASNQASNQAINHLILILTTRCQLRCLYCYNGAEPPLDMDREVLTRGIALAAKSQGPLRVQLTGGEPTLVPELIEAAALEVKKLDRPYRLSLQTNATSLDAALVKLLKKHSFEVGVSLDGPPDINEAQRGGAREVIRGLTALDQGGLPYTVTTVVTSLNCQELYKVPLILAQRKAALGLGLDLLVHKGRAGAVSPEFNSLYQGVKELGKTLDFINAQRVRPLRLREEEFLRKARSGRKGGFCAACSGQSLAVAPNGYLYPCGQTAFDPKFLLGQIASPGKLVSPLAQMSLTGSHCHTCALKGACPGECPSRLSYNQLTDPPLACAIYQALASR